MRVCGIVAEYNPFHNGHRYHIKEAKRKTNADVVIVAMSGNFLQRGEPAIIDKWARAKLALEYGADIVIEIPAAFSVQSADLYAKGAIELLAHMGIDVLCFGSESGEGADFLHAAKLFLDNEKEIDALFKTEQKQKLTYAKNMSDILTAYFPELKLDLTEPNNMLGFAYAKEIRTTEYVIDIETIRRKSSHYHDKEVIVNNEIASATAIRKELFSGTTWENFKTLPFPEKTKEILDVSKHVQWDDFFSYLKYRIMTTSLSELSEIYLMEKGLEYRLKKVVEHSMTMNDFLTRLKTRQLSWTRLQRLSYYILVNQKKTEIKTRLERIEYIRVLGFNKTGQTYLNQKKHQFKRPLVTNVNKKNSDLLAYDIMVGEIYRLADQSKIDAQDYIRKPIKLD